MNIQKFKVLMKLESCTTYQLFPNFSDSVKKFILIKNYILLLQMFPLVLKYNLTIVNSVNILGRQEVVHLNEILSIEYQYGMAATSILSGKFHLD